MKRFSIVLLLAAFITFGTSCQKKVHKIDDSFVGTWTTSGPDSGDSSTLIIDDEGDGLYEEYQDGQRVEYAEGPVRLNNDNVLKIGSRSGFRVTQFPTDDPDTDLNFNPDHAFDLTMKLEKRFFYKK